LTYSVSAIGAIINGKFLSGKDCDREVQQLLLDSRKLLFPGTSLFFALGGPRRNGATYIPDLYAKGVKSFVVDHHFDVMELARYPGSAFLQVNNVLESLQKLVAHHRSLFNIPVVGITGSNGKTIVKEWLFQLLHEEVNIVRSPRSYNSQVGVPLSVWQMDQSHELGLFEAGISMPGEMRYLQSIIKPTIGVLTNIGEAHSEGFSSIEQKLREKLMLFAESGTLIYGSDDEVVSRTVSNFTGERPLMRVFSWGHKDDAQLKLLSVEKTATDCRIVATDQRTPGNRGLMEITIPFTDDASVQNAITCWCVLLHLQTRQAIISAKMARLRAVEMRMELKQGINNCSVINDSYSADINSLAIALEFLLQQQQHPNRTVVLSDILESGKASADLYEEVAAILMQKKINRLIGIGPEIYKCREAFDAIPQRAFFGSVAEFLQQFYSLHFYNETILLKGARIFGFEQVSHLLEAKLHQTVLEINLNALSHNLRAYQELLKPGVKLMAMVKAFSYGSGGFEIANLLQFHKVDYLAVAYADEGVELRRAGISLPILVLNPEEATFDVVVQYDLEPELYSFGILASFREYLERSGINKYPVHIKLDTGMHRLGFEAKDIPALAAGLQASALFKVQSVFSHLAASDAGEHDSFTRAQADQFISGCKTLEAVLGYSFIRHIANTSSIHRHPQLQLDMVRLGIGLYGVDHDAAMQEKLRNVSTLKTTISQIKQVAAGESVGYSRRGTVSRDSVIATVRIGYADGYPRVLSNGAGRMWVQGSLVPVIGNVCMDMTMLDITGSGIQEGDEVIVFGEELPVDELADWAGTIPYEVLTGISQRVKRVYYEE
jgi:alanine racemase